MLFWLSAGALAAWLWLLTLHGRFWRADIRLPDAPEPAAWPSVVAVIPARDEAQSIAAIVKAHLATDYPGDFRLIIVDDSSSDGTAARAREAAGGDPRLCVLAGAPLAPGWTGKLWAQQQGIALALAEAPDWLLLCDADIRFGAQTVRRLVAFAERERLSLASLMSRLDSRGGIASLLIPSFIFFFQKLYPFAWVNDARRRTAGAAGGVMLVRAGAVRAHDLPASIRGALIDDCALAARVKHGPPAGRLWLGLARQVEAVSLRDNRALASIWTMVRRTAYAQLGYSPLFLVGALLGMVWLYLTGPVALLLWPLTGQGWAALVGAAAWTAMAVALAPTLADYGKPRILGFALPLAGLLYTAMTFDSAWSTWRGRGGRWKNRSYPSGAL